MPYEQEQIVPGETVPTEPLSPEVWLWLQIATQQALETLELMQLGIEQQQGVITPRTLATKDPKKEHRPLPLPLMFSGNSNEILKEYERILDDYEPEITNSELLAYALVQGRYLQAEIGADGDASDDINDILGEFGESQSSLLIALRDQPELIETVLEMSRSPEEALGLLFAYEQNPAILKLLLDPRKDDNSVLSPSHQTLNK